MTDATLSPDFLLTRLQSLRESVLWKIEGVDEYQLRRPLTPTGTTMLGLVKHLAACELGYFGDCFGRPSRIARPWVDAPAADNADMWATESESVDHIVALYRAAWAHAAITFDMPFDTPGVVPWWSEGHRNVTLGEIVVHMTTETARHVGQLDILRENTDGAVGLHRTNDNLTHTDLAERAAYTARIQAVADDVQARSRVAQPYSDDVDERVEQAAERGDLGELRRLAAAGNSDATDLLVESATEREDFAELTRLAAAGSTTAADVLDELTEQAPPR